MASIGEFPAGYGIYMVYQVYGMSGMVYGIWIILSFRIMGEGAVSLWGAREQFVAHLDGDEGLGIFWYCVWCLMYGIPGMVYTRVYGYSCRFYVMWERAVSLWAAREKFVAHLDGDEGLRLVGYLSKYSVGYRIPRYMVYRYGVHVF